MRNLLKLFFILGLGVNCCQAAQIDLQVEVPKNNIDLKSDIDLMDAFEAMRAVLSSESEDEDGDSESGSEEDSVVSADSESAIDLVIYMDIEPVQAPKMTLNQFFNIILDGKIELVKEVVESGRFQLDDKDKEGRQAIHMAAQSKFISILDYLIEKGANPSAQAYDGYQPIHDAAAEGRIGIIDRLIVTHKVDVCAKYGNSKQGGLMPIHEAAYNNKLDVVKHLIEEHGVLADVKSNMECQPIHSAALGGSLEVIVFLVNEIKVDINTVTKDKKTPLDLVRAQLVNYKNNKKELASYRKAEAKIVSLGGLSFAEIVAKRAEQKDQQKPITKTSLFFEAIRGGGLEKVKEIVEADPSIVSCKSKEDEGRESIHIAAQSGDIGIIEYLISKDANPSAQAYDGYQPIHDAAAEGHIPVVDALVEKYGVDVYSRYDRKEGYLPIHEAAYCGQVAMVDHFIKKYGMSPGSLSLRGYQPIHSACLDARLGVVDLLIGTYKVSVEVEAYDGYRPIHSAVKSKDATIVDHLVRNYKADVNAETNKKDTPLDFAEDDDVIDVLINFGAEESC